VTESKELLKQARLGFQKNIDEDRQSIMIYRKGMIADGFGGLMQDPFGAGTPTTIICRICEGRGNPSILTGSPVGLSENLVKYIIVNYKADIQEHDTFDSRGKTYRIGNVETIVNFGGIIGYQAQLIESTEIGAAT